MRAHRWSLITLALLAACTPAANTGRSPASPSPPTFASTPVPTPSLPPATATQFALNQAGLASPKGDGAYLVGVHLARGVWRSDGKAADPAQDCYWLTRKANGIILKSYLGRPGVQQVNFDVYDYEVSFENCGAWRYLGTPTPTITPTPTPTP
jgi:hypothetical protein